MNTTTINPELTALHELAKSSPGGVEGCAWWPECIRLRMGEWWYINEWRSSEIIDHQHALDLVVAEAERFLRSREWNMVSPGLEHEREWEHDPQGTGYMPLPEALRYAMKDN